MRESWLLYFNCLPDVFGLLVFLALPRGAVGWSAMCHSDLCEMYKMLIQQCDQRYPSS